MKSKISKLSIITISFFGLVPVFLSQTLAQSISPICQIFPFLQGIQLFGGICDVRDENVQSGVEGLVRGALNLVRYASSLIFVLIIAVAIYVIIKSSVKYITSEGDAAKVQEAQKAIKTVFMGVAALIVGIIGIVVLLVFFQSSGALNPDLPDIFNGL